MKSTYFLKIILFFLLNILYVNYLFADLIPKKLTLNPIDYQRCNYYFSLTDSSWHYGFGMYDLGRSDIESTTYQDIHRSGWEFDLQNIPDDATIDSVRMRGYLRSAQYFCLNCTAKFRKIPSNSFLHDPQALYIAIGNSQITILDGINYDVPFEEISENLSDIISNYLTPPRINSLKIGLLSEREDQDQSAGYLDDFQLEIFYSVPQDTFFVKVENSFGAGFLIVDGDTIQSGTQFMWFENDEHSLRAFDQDWPSPNYYYRIFQNWQEGSNFYQQNLLIITVIKNSTYKANFLRRFDFKADNNFVNGGSGGNIRVNGVLHYVPLDTFVIESNSIQLYSPIHNFNINGKNINYRFLQWNDESLVNPRFFVPTDHLCVIANYKGHLVSNTSTSIAFNNQRKLV